MRSRSARLAIFAVAPTVLLLLAGEIGARILFTVRLHDPRYLIAPFGSARTAAPVQYPALADRSYRTHLDPCSGRTLTFSVSPDGGRGPHWTPVRTAGTRRILVVGESSTFGVNSPDDATWPARLEAVYRERGASVEVLNGGEGGTWLERILERLDVWLPKYRPDVVIYYGGHNDANPDTRRFADPSRALWFERFTRWLYYRSMLYTYLVEKLHFATQTAGRFGTVPDVATFRFLAERLITRVQEHGARPIVALQVTRVPAVPALVSAPLDDVDRLREMLRTLATAAGTTERDRIDTLRALKTQVLVETARRTAVARGVPALDPRPAFAGDGATGSFCDEIHLTDHGNDRLARAVYEALR